LKKSFAVDCHQKASHVLMRDAAIGRQRRQAGGPLPTTTPGIQMNMHLSLTPLISLIAGVLILVMPKLLNFIIAIYLIVIGLVGLFGSGHLNLT